MKTSTCHSLPQWENASVKDTWEYLVKGKCMICRIPRLSVERKYWVLGKTIVGMGKYFGMGVYLHGYGGYIWDTGIEDILGENVVITKISNMW
jgi:hypothetical protein